jgi:fumarate reductase flavoprotein subunit
MALDTGLVPIGNPEAIQFHPTGIVPTNILITEGCRGDGGTLLDVNLQRFMQNYEPEKAELASRDVVSRWMTTHIRKGFGVKSDYGDHLWLDIRHLGEKHIKTKLREVAEICYDLIGVDPVTQLIPVRPAQHYTMAGIRTDKDGAAYGLSGLFSAGEAACWDLHGFNRLGGNSLGETIVAGKIIGKKIVEFLEGYEAVAFNSAIIKDAISRDRDRISRLVSCSDGNEDVFKIRNAMQDELMDKVGIFRNGKDLQKAVDNLRIIHEKSKHVGLRSKSPGVNPELSIALKIQGMVRLALCTAYAALVRTESRGCHAREDFEARNDRDWLKRTLATWKQGDELPTLNYEPFTKVMELPPGSRGYGSVKIIKANDEVVEN